MIILLIPPYCVAAAAAFRHGCLTAVSQSSVLLACACYRDRSSRPRPSTRPIATDPTLELPAGEVDEEELDAELDDDEAEYIQGLQPLPRGGAASSKAGGCSRRHACMLAANGLTLCIMLCMRRGLMGVAVRAEAPAVAPAWKGLQELPVRSCACGHRRL